MVEYYDPKPAQKKPLNGAQFSQMGLFEQPKPSEEHRYQKGYTPERKAQVQEAIAGSKITVDPKFKYAYGGGPSLGGPMFKQSRNIMAARSEAGRKPLSAQRMSKSRSEHARNVITETVARSTAPLEAMGQIPDIQVSARAKSGGWYSHPGRLKGGSWEKGVQRESERGLINLSPTPTAHAEHTIMHELGHHADYQADPETFSVRAMRNPSPALEGAAEGFAAAHVRQHPKAEPVSYSQLASYRFMHGNPIFEGRFQEVSGKTVGEAMAMPKPAHMSQQFDPQAPVQQRLFGRPVDESKTMTEGDYGQWGYTHYPEGRESDLGTIKTGRGAPEQSQRMMHGFRPGDADILRTLEGRGSYEEQSKVARSGEAERVARTHNRAYPGRKPLK